MDLVNNFGEVFSSESSSALSFIFATLSYMPTICTRTILSFYGRLKRYFSVLPLEYVNVVRLEKASHLLLSDMDLTIEQVAYQVGFNDYRYFGRSFKKRYGLTPSSYRGLENLNSNKKEMTD